VLTFVKAFKAIIDVIYAAPRSIYVARRRKCFPTPGLEFSRSAKNKYLT